ncbi:MAG: glycoside hydrolase family 19 protein, partial [Panacagrimonas sp.]
MPAETLSETQWGLIFGSAKRRGAQWPDNADVLAYKQEILAALGLIADAPPAPPALPSLNKWQAMIDLPLLKLAFPANRDLAPWVEPTRAACVRWGIDTVREIASFLANINVESAGLTRLTENLNYSVEALIAKFGRHRISLADAKRWGRSSAHPANQEMIANLLYGGEWGRKNLGNTEPGDGWLCRGYGPKQVTGRANQQAFADAMGMSFPEAQASMRTPVGGMMAAGWFWHSHGLDAKAATPGVEDDRRAINGGTFG